MKITNRDKKLLRFWPVIWPLLGWLLFRHHKMSDWWDFFFVGVAILVGIIAIGYGFYAVARFIRKQKKKAKAKATYAPARAVNAFTLIELLVVIAIIGILAALVGPTVTSLLKGDSSVAATRQLLDDCARARQLAIANRSTVYIAFVPTNFWNDPLRPGFSANQWTMFASDNPGILKSTTVTNLYGAQLNGYVIYSLQKVGDQPGQHYPEDLVRVKTLPSHSFFSPIKFSWPPYSWDPTNPTPPFVIQNQFPMYGFLKTNTLPFPTADALTNSTYVAHLLGGSFPTVPYIAFNYQGQLTRGDGSLLPYDEYIPISYGSIVPSKTQTIPSAIEDQPGNSTNISYNLIHIDHFTGRARLERTD